MTRRSYRKRGPKSLYAAVERRRLNLQGWLPGRRPTPVELRKLDARIESAVPNGSDGRGPEHHGHQSWFNTRQSAGLVATPAGPREP